jgi:hypothetical protein
MAASHRLEISSAKGDPAPRPLARGGTPPVHGRVVDCAVDGLDTYDLFGDSPMLSSMIRPGDVVLCYCGSNDVFNGNNMTTAASKLEVFFAKCACPILYVRVMHSPYAAYFDAWRELPAFHDRIERSLSSRSDGSKTVRVDESLERSDFLWDGVHLTARGYLKVLSRLREHLDFFFPSGEYE